MSSQGQDRLKLAGAAVLAAVAVVAVVLAWRVSFGGKPSGDETLRDAYAGMSIAELEGRLTDLERFYAIDGLRPGDPGTEQHAEMLAVLEQKREEAGLESAQQ